MQDLYGNIVLSGGTSMFPGMADRMSKEVRLEYVMMPLHVTYCVGQCETSSLSDVADEKNCWSLP